MEGDVPTSNAVLYEQVGRVVRLTINRPKAMNAVNGDVAEALAQSLLSVENDVDVRCVVLCGSGTKAFSAGADIFALTKHGRAAVRSKSFPEWGFAGIINNPFSKPIIAAVNGVAFGGGMEILLACDVIIAADHARFGFPEVTVGVVPAGGGATRLARTVPLRRATELLLTGRRIDAAEALELGMINRVVPHADLDAVAMDVATEIAENAPLAVQSTLRIIKRTLEPKGVFEDVWSFNNSEADAIVASNDAREGAQAFREKRKPVWTAS